MGTQSVAKLTLSHRVLCRKMRSLGGKGSAAELGTSYVKVEPLIRYGYVRVLSDNGVAIYELTDAGDIWAGDD